MTITSKIKITVAFVFLSTVLFLALPVTYQVSYPYCFGGTLDSYPPQCAGEFKYYSEYATGPVVKSLPVLSPKIVYQEYQETIENPDLYPARSYVSPTDLLVRVLAATIITGGILYIIKRRTALF